MIEILTAQCLVESGMFFEGECAKVGREDWPWSVSLFHIYICKCFSLLKVGKDIAYTIAESCKDVVSLCSESQRIFALSKQRDLLVSYCQRQTLFSQGKCDEESVVE